jgi:hypothetical protein
MLRKMTLVLALLGTATALSACVVAGPPGRPACPWVAGHYGAYGVWHPGHCA